MLEIAEDTSASVPAETADSSEENAPPLSRRGLATGLAGLMLGGAAGALWTKHNTGVDPTVALPEASFEVGETRQVMERISSAGPMLFPRESPRIAVTIWDPESKAKAGGRTAREVYGEDGEGHPVAEGTGFMALDLRSTARGCRVPYCEASGWFEDPCHLSKWNSWGEWTWGDAPRGLDRYGSSIRPDGTLVVSLTVQITGPSTETRFGESEPSGPFCVEV